MRMLSRLPGEVAVFLVQKFLGRGLSALGEI